MNRPDCAFGYAQTRLQARLGLRPGGADWQRIDGTRDLATLLKATGTSSLTAWTAGLDVHGAPHDLEHKLRSNWLLQIDEIARWQPQPWRASTRWLRWLPYLPALAKLARGGRAPDWMRTDAVLGPIVATEPRLRPAALKRTALAPLAQGFGTTPDVAGAWVREWRSLWPARTATRPGLQRVLHEVATYQRDLAAAAPSEASADLNARLARRLLTVFRRHPLSPVAAIAYIGLSALDFARLRGAVAVRALRTAGQGAA